MGWCLHLLNARGRLSDVEAELRAALVRAEARLAEVAPAVALDVVIRI